MKKSLLIAAFLLGGFAFASAQNTTTNTGTTKTCCQKDANKTSCCQKDAHGNTTGEKTSTTQNTTTGTQNTTTVTSGTRTKTTDATTRQAPTNTISSTNVSGDRKKADQ